MSRCDDRKRMKINHEEPKNTKTFFCSFFVFFVSSWLFSEGAFM
jgi:hypothetical protein